MKAFESIACLFVGKIAVGSRYVPMGGCGFTPGARSNDTADCNVGCMAD